MALNDPALVIGHRGAAGLAPENTLPSFVRAVELGVNAIELDVHVVAGELVVIHDDTVDRTTNGCGAVANFGLAPLRALDAGDGWPVPLLDEVVSALPDGIGVNIELKGPGTAAPAAAFLGSRPSLDVVVSSFDHRQLDEFHRLAPQIRVGPLFSRWRGDPWAVAAGLEAWSVHLSLRAATAERLREARRRGYRPLVYTVNRLEQARALVADGAAGIFTDRPDRITPAALAGSTPGRADTARR